MSVKHLPGASLIHVRGTVDENFDRDTFVGGLTGATGPVLIDVGDVPRLTSFGVREFMTALREAGSRARFFVRCRPTMIAQFNSIPQFGGTSQILSLYCPYVCPDCDEDFEVLLDVRAGAPRSAPPATCPTCGQAAEFDDVDTFYFAYIKSRPPAPVPAVVTQLVDGSYRSTQSFRVEKAVEGELTLLRLHGDLDHRARLQRHAEGLEGTVLIDLSGVTSIGEGGVARLAQLLSAPGGDLYVVRVPLAVARALASGPTGFGRSSIASVVATASCPSCGGSVEIDATDPQSASATSRCALCDASIEVPIASTDRALLGALPMVDPPALVMAYMGRGERTLGIAAGDSREASSPLGDIGLAEGSRLGEYEVIRRIGVAGIAEVFLGCRRSMDGFQKKLVIKRVLPQLAAEERFVEMFLEEARMAARLCHTHIAQIYDLGKDGEDYFLVMEHVHGLDLNAILRLAVAHDISLPVPMCCRIVADLAGALEAAHTFSAQDGTTTPIVHGDVCPRNVLVSLAGMVKLAGFGMARAAESVSATHSDLIFKGRTTYLAPETERDEEADHRVDVFAAGLVLYVCLTQHHPFPLRDHLDSAAHALERPVPPVRELRPDVPPKLAEIVQRAMEFDRAVRTPTAGVLQRELEEILAQCGEPAGRPALARWMKHLVREGKNAARLSEVESAVAVSARSKSSNAIFDLVPGAERIDNLLGLLDE